MVLKAGGLMKLDREQVRQIIDLIPEKCVLYKVIGERISVLYSSAGISAVLGITEDNYNSRHCENAAAYILPADLPAVMEAVGCCIETRGTVTEYWRMKYGENGFIWVRGNINYCGEEDGCPLLFVVYWGSNSDTDFYKQVVDNSTTMAIVSDTDTYEMLYANNAARKYCEADGCNIKGSTCYSYFFGRDEPCVDCFAENIRFGETLTAERENKKSGRWEYLCGKRINWCGRDAVIKYIQDITESKSLQKQLSDAKQKYDIAVEGAGLFVWEYDIENHRIIGGNNIFGLYGFDRTIENVPLSLLPRIREEDHAKFIDFYRRVEAGEKDTSVDIRLITGDDRPDICQRVIYTVISDKDGVPVKAYGVAIDITAQKKEEARYIASIESLIHANPDALSTFELNLTKDECIDVRSISPQLAEALASDTAEEVYSRAYAQIIDENGKRDFESKFRRQALLDSFGAGHTSVQTEFQRYNDSGKLIWVRAYINMLENPETSDIEGIVYSVDITEEKRNEKIFRIISDEEYDYVALLHLGDRKMQFLNLSPRLLPKYHEKLGNMKLIEYDKVREFGLATWIAEEDRDFYLKNSAIDVITRELDASGHFELSVSGHYTGQPDIFMYRKIQHYYLDENKDTVLLIESDITDTVLRQKNETERFKREAERARDILDYIPDGVCVLRMPDREHLLIEYSNKQMPILPGFVDGVQEPAEISGDTEESVIQYFSNAFLGVHPEDLPRVRDDYRRGYDKSQFSVAEFRLITASGDYIWVSVDVALREERNDGKIFYGLYRDVSEEVRLKKEVEEQQRINIERTMVEAIGSLPSSSVLFRIMDDGKIRPERLSEEFTHMTGFGQEDVQMISDGFEKVYPADKDILMDIINENAGKKDTFNAVFRMLTKEDGIIWVSCNFNVFVFGGVRYLYAEYTDIDDIKEQEKLLEEQYDAAKAFQDSLTGSYIAASRFDITDNIVEEVRGTEPLPQAAVQATYDESLEVLLKSMPRGHDRAACADFFSRSHLQHEFEAGRRSLTQDYQYREEDGSIKWAEAVVTLTGKPHSSNIIAFVTVRDVTEEKMLDMTMVSMADDQFDYVCCTDGNTGKIIMYRSGRGVYGDVVIESGMDYSTVTLEYNNRYIAGGDLEYCNSFMELQNVVDMLKRGERCICSFSVDEGAGVRAKQVEYLMLDSESNIIGEVRTDFTDAQQKQIEQESRLREALDQADEANEAKSEFLSRMSHDMRTPLNGIIGMTHIAGLQDNPEKTAECLRNIDTSSKFLMGLINDVLDMTKAEQSEIMLYPEPYTVDEFNTYLAAVIEPLCRTKNQRFILDEKQDSGRVPLADKLRINQIIFNLLSNAVKYTQEGGTIKYEITYEMLSESRIAVTHIISDNGIGMSEKFQSVLFEPFVQEGRRETSESRGTGLGLAIVKRMVDAMGGTITVQSRLGEGTAFTVRLEHDTISADEVETASGNGKASGDEIDTLAGRHVLLCEDHPLNQEIAGSILDECKVITEIADNGEIGLEKFSRSPVGYYDAVLMDIRMPVMDGYETTKMIRSLDRADAKTVPIIAMTADAFSEDVRKCLDAGMDGHVPKPVEPDLLFSTLISKMKERK